MRATLYTTATTLFGDVEVLIKGNCYHLTVQKCLKSRSFAIKPAFSFPELCGKKVFT